MPTTTREAILQGVQAATELHKKIDSKKAVEKTGQIDVFKSIGDQGYGLLFRPIKGILGACMQVPAPGVLVTTQRPLNVQRFTAAHELGHLEMGHDFSLDNEAQFRSFAGRTEAELQEVSANVFSAEFLMPTWLLYREMDRRKWVGNDLKDPRIVYQLSLRIGTSYEALCRTLERHKWIDSDIARRLLSVAPKQIKDSLLQGLSLDDPWANVWVLTAPDHDIPIQAGPTDIFILNFFEHGSSGYLWNVEDLSTHGFAIQETTPKASDTVAGEIQTREWFLTGNEASKGYALLSETRPWLPNEALNSFGFEYDLQGKEVGYPRYQREMLEAA